MNVKGDVKTEKCNVDQFVVINRMIDEQLEEEEGDDDQSDDGIQALSEQQGQQNPQGWTNYNDYDKTSALQTPPSATYGEVDRESIDIWDKDIEPETYMDPEFVAYLQAYFIEKGIKSYDMDLDAVGSDRSVDVALTKGSKKKASRKEQLNNLLLNHSSFCNWTDVKEVLREGKY